jgi:hypothetical protein
MGRGLDLVATYATRSAADDTRKGLGKVVWFEPSDGILETPVEGEVFDMESVLAALEPLPLDEPVTIVLLGMPVELFLHLRRHFNELGRELRLLALSEPDRYPLAVEFSDTYLQVEHERRHVAGLDVLEQAMQDGIDSVDLTYEAPSTAPSTMTRLSALLQHVYAELTGKVLLSVRPPLSLMDLQGWYLGEFARQARGEEPTRWDGPLRLRLPSRREVS